MREDGGVGGKHVTLANRQQLVCIVKQGSKHHSQGHYCQSGGQIGHISEPQCDIV